MSLLSIAWRNLLMRRVQTFISVLVVAVGVAMTLSVFLLSRGVQDGIAEASEPYGMLVGSKGSSTQLVFNTIYLMDNPLGNLPWSYYESLKHDARIQEAVPFALGDNYEGFRIVGTEPSFFQLRAKPSEPAYFQLKEGRLFDAPFEAVLGGRVAELTGLRIGDQFQSSHGVVQAVEADDTHAEHPYTVVGILQEKQVPADKGIYVNMDSYWIGHGQTVEAESGGEGEHHEDAAEHGDEAHSSLAAEDGHDHEGEPGVTAVLVKPDSYMNLMKLYQEINNGTQAQAVFPGQVLAKIFDMMGTGEDAMRGVSYVILGMAALTIALSLYGSNLERRRHVAIMRAIGAGRSSIFAVVMLESLWIVLLGAALGFGGGLALSSAIAGAVMNESSLVIELSPEWSDLRTIAAVCALGVAAGIVPAIAAYRTEAAKHLNPL